MPTGEPSTRIARLRVGAVQESEDQGYVGPLEGTDVDRHAARLGARDRDGTPFSGAGTPKRVDRTSRKGATGRPTPQ